MDKYINSYEGYSFWELSNENLYELAKFIVTENYKHHQNTSERIIEIEAKQVFEEELHYLNYSRIFIARDEKMDIVGAIRILEWNRKDTLPMTKLFSIDPFNHIVPTRCNERIWHIGRFAISSKVGRLGVVVFKILMSSVISLICRYGRGVMLSECDSKLLRMLHLMGIAAKPLSDGIEYLGSLTIPMYVTRDGLEFFYNNHKQLSIIKH